MPGLPCRIGRIVAVRCIGTSGEGIDDPDDDDEDEGPDPDSFQAPLGSRLSHSDLRMREVFHSLTSGGPMYEPAARFTQPLESKRAGGEPARFRF